MSRSCLNTNLLKLFVIIYAHFPIVTIKLADRSILSLMYIFTIFSFIKIVYLLMCLIKLRLNIRYHANSCFWSLRCLTTTSVCRVLLFLFLLSLFELQRCYNILLLLNDISHLVLPCLVSF